ncbi:hypothetical protein [Accumulibacter sp.]|uniref:hypothetical protein n=1 Tax=Accumulibacter sp. TaxID=2053492 RepID=UPI0025D8F2FB|nr:hypothetical protein [Accumulibacter sp.]MCM8596904.1 hypothetical protein [Accumulibacter sp.]MCM8624402.1 hypothetical protein [Accumulibacter sp.]MDS4051052.1 hypothetical protein [Accumulibacter sp.]
MREGALGDEAAVGDYLGRLKVCAAVIPIDGRAAADFTERDRPFRVIVTDRVMLHE